MDFDAIKTDKTIMNKKRRLLEISDPERSTSSIQENRQSLELAILYRNAEVNRLRESIKLSHGAKDQISLPPDITEKCQQLSDIAERFKQGSSETENEVSAHEVRGVLESSEMLSRELKLLHMKMLKYKSNKLQSLINKFVDMEQKSNNFIILDFKEQFACIYDNYGNGQEDKALKAYDRIIQKATENAYFSEIVDELKKVGLIQSEEECRLRVKESLFNCEQDPFPKESDQLIEALNQSYSDFIKVLSMKVDPSSYKWQEKKERLFSAFNNFSQKIEIYALACKKLLESVHGVAYYDQSLRNFPIESYIKYINVAQRDLHEKDALLKREVVKLLQGEASAELPLDGTSFWSKDNQNKTIVHITCGLNVLKENLSKSIEMGISNQSACNNEIGASEKSSYDQVKHNKDKKNLTELLNQSYEEFIKSLEEEKYYRSIPTNLQKKQEKLFITFNDLSHKIGEYVLSCKKLLETIKKQKKSNNESLDILNMQNGIRNLNESLDEALASLYEKDILLKEDVPHILQGGKNTLLLILHPQIFWSEKDRQQTIDRINMVSDEIKEIVGNLLKQEDKMDISDQSDSEDDIPDTKTSFAKIRRNRVELCEATLLRHKRWLANSMDEIDQTLVDRIDENIKDLKSLIKDLKRKRPKNEAESEPILRSCKDLIDNLKLNHVRKIGESKLLTIQQKILTDGNEGIDVALLDDHSRCLQNYSKNSNNTAITISTATQTNDLTSSQKSNKDAVVAAYDYLADLHLKYQLQISEFQLDDKELNLLIENKILYCQNHSFLKEETLLKEKADNDYKSFRKEFFKTPPSDLLHRQNVGNNINTSYNQFLTSFLAYSSACKETIELIKTQITSKGACGQSWQQLGESFDKTEDHFKNATQNISLLTQKLLDPNTVIDQDVIDWIKEDSSVWSRNDEARITKVTEYLSEVSLEWSEQIIEDIDTD